MNHSSTKSNVQKWTINRLKSFHPNNRQVEYYKNLFNLSMDGVVVIDQVGTIHLANPAMEGLLRDHHRDGIVGSRFDEFVVENFREDFRSLLHLTTYQSTPIPPLELALQVDEDKEIPVQVSMATIQMNGEQMIQLVVRDISEWKWVQDELIRSNMELEQTYRETLDGWGRALELRDYETEGHTQRVTEMTVNLAYNLGMSVEQIVHIRHGALLHDIGKMAIPDQILRKPGPLTPEEWVEMKRHPVYAFKLLQPIDYLRPAIEIPYCHHERWDGAGYPNNLRGKEIPFSARIFAVIDVWDALLNDRPYRQGWPKERVLRHIAENAGSQFDPQVVDMFLKIV